MSSAYVISALIILVIECIVGIMGNGLITAVICIDWIKGSKLTSCDMILGSLGISRFLCQCVITVESFIFLHFLENCNVFQMIFPLMVFLNYLCLWFATWLSVFYCVKIATFSQLLFLWMKQRISSLVPWLLLGSLFVSFGASVPLVFLNYKICGSNKTLLTDSHQGRKLDFSTHYVFIVHLLGPFIPFLIFMVSTTLLITSLWQHTRRMQREITNFLDPQTKAHVVVIKSQISFVVFYFSYYVALMSSVIYYFNPISSKPWINAIVMAAYPSGHSVILILLNPKLRQGSVRIVSPPKCHLKEAS
ncbi:taste receptor type 2 member 40-like [Carettochelys insculpta]|uniref:taste receptor type 2 member 40-like n=1 Tax=Carettochelys insculpta TaxID=44489 RepID=UPI003EBDA866